MGGAKASVTSNEEGGLERCKSVQRTPDVSLLAFAFVGLLFMPKCASDRKQLSSFRFVNGSFHASYRNTRVLWCRVIRMFGLIIVISL